MHQGILKHNRKKQEFWLQYYVFVVEEAGQV